MYISDVTMGQIERLLTKFGFVRHVVSGLTTPGPDSCLYFDKPNSEHAFIFPVYGEHQRIPLVHVMSTASFLETWDYLDRAEFPNLLTEGRGPLPYKELRSITPADFRNVTYAMLEATLLRFGFVRFVTPSGHFCYEHPDGATVTTGKFAPEQIAHEVHVMVARSTVDNWGIAERETFEKMLAECSAGCFRCCCS